MKFDHYYRFSELEEALKGLTAQYPHLASLDSVGKSGEGRDLWLITITQKETGSPEKKPAFYIDGNHHAGEVTGSMISLYIINYLLKNFEKDQKVRNLLQRYTFYVLPRVSPDGAEVYLTSPKTLRSVPRFYPYPNPEEKEGLYPFDVDGDGEILLMRVKDPTGEWKVSPKDPRALCRRLPDEEEGVFYRVYTEGLIRDYRGGPVTEAPPEWGLDLNRNYPYAWSPDTRQPGAGEFPLSEPETRSVAEFIVKHPNISLAFTYHTTGGMILRVPGTHPAEKSPYADIQALIAIGEMGTEETGYPCLRCYEDFSGGGENYSTGAFDDWLYEQRGILGYTVETWNMAQRAGVAQWPRRPKSTEEQDEDLLRFLAWNDRELGGKGFVNWHPFNHPQLGQVEIGGWSTKFCVQNAPLGFLEAECHKNAMFALRAGATLPRLEISRAEVRSLGEDVYEVRVTVRNLGYLPTCGSQQALNMKKAEPIEAVIGPWTQDVGQDVEQDTMPGKGQASQAGVEIVGKAKKEIGQLEGRSGSTGGFGLGWFRGRSGKREEIVTWVVKAPKGTNVQVRVQSKRAGCATTNLVLE